MQRVAYNQAGQTMPRAAAEKESMNIEHLKASTTPQKRFEILLALWHADPESENYSFDDVLGYRTAVEEDFELNFSGFFAPTKRQTMH